MKDLLRIRIKALALVAILLLSVVGGLSAKKIAIIDAGSSGSRLYVYDVKLNESDLKVTIGVLFPKDQVELDRSKGTALSDVVDGKKAVGDFMNEMANKYTEVTSEKIDLYILATAGMRLKSPAIYDEMLATKAYGCFNLINAMTISGQYEGLYAWIAANYKNNKLTWTVSGWSFNDSYSILEIGGASMQIAFNTSVKQFEHPCFGNVYSKSYLGGGVDQVFEYSRSNSITSYVNRLDNDMPNPYGNPKFVRLGAPMEKAIEAANGETIEKLNAYADSQGEEDIQYHVKTNAKYIACVFAKWNLDGKTIKAGVQSNWTEGAAIDIVINDAQPEPFSYPPAIPN